MGELSMWTIYDRPKDHPQGFIARRFRIIAGAKAPSPTNDTLTAGTLDMLRSKVEAKGCAGYFPRQEGDDPSIVETWL